MKSSLGELILKKERQESRIASSILQIEELDEEQIEKIYNDKLRTINDQKEEVQNHIIALKTQANQLQTDIEAIDAELNNLLETRKKCPESNTCPM